MNLLFTTLLPGTNINITALDWNNIAGADVNLNALLTQLNGGVVVSDPSQVLNANITLAQLQAALVSVLQADGQTLAANSLNLLTPSLSGLTGTIRLADLLQVSLPPGSLANVNLDVLDLITGGVQLYNFRNVVTTPTPITLTTAQLAPLGLGGLANVRVWAQVVEPPVYNCGPVGSAFHSAAIRIKFDFDIAQGLNVAPLISAVNGLNVGGLVSLSGTAITASLLHLSVYADVARAEGTINAVNLASNAVTLQARPGLVNLYIGTISDAVFFNRSAVLTPASVTPINATTLNVTVAVSLLSSALKVADVDVPLTVSLRAVATGTPGFQSVAFTGPYPQTRTLSTGTVSASLMVTTLINSLDVQITSGTPVVRLVNNLITLPLPVNTIVNAVVGVLLPPLRTVTNALVGPVLTAVLGGVVDNLLGLLGIRIGQAIFTVESISQSCAATVQLVKTLAPTTDTGVFNLSVAQGATVLASVANVGNNGATTAVVTTPGTVYTLAETAGTATVLARYASTWDCRDAAGTVLTSGTGQSFNFTAPALSAQPLNVVCRITNRTRQADLSITKSDGSGSYTPGGTASYVITVSNAGPDPVTAAQVTDTLPAGATLSAPWTCTASAGSVCSAASGGAAGGTGVSLGVNLINGGQATITVPVSFSADPAAY
ncbi:hypothetical protein [Stenotrophomonas oahuensis]|uniref:DUF11 domain-containing protein n=1 Tax=Stenotrophomonas oahuensis TaxID=3003271 RepID=A0ABY9YRV1_9GAMM|nr:hypothetical protein [Stenotrophomonas sp. A5586]WNH53665.1 hypothetical protein PDM29_05120 [Stenotrophomonas sp. A5586]